MPNVIDPAGQHDPTCTDPEPYLTQCPSWCTAGGSHDLEPLVCQPEAETRTHAHRAGGLQTAEDGCGVDVEVMSESYVVLSECGVTAYATDPVAALFLDPRGKDALQLNLDAGEARRLGALLLGAAEVLDRISGR